MNETLTDDAQMRYLDLLLQAGNKPVWQCNWFGKNYILLKSPSGQIFSEKLPEEDNADT